ncbi:unnamed protein product, partial [Mesorhabditis spiculigera]
MASAWCYRSLLIFGSISSVFTQWSIDQVCYSSFYLNSPQPAPIKCPPNDYFSYYECCDGRQELCCRKPRAVLIIILIIVLLCFICLMACCVFGFILRLRRWPKKKKNEDAEAQTSKKASVVETGAQTSSVAPDDEFVMAYAELRETKC